MENETIGGAIVSRFNFKIRFKTKKQLLFFESANEDAPEYDSNNWAIQLALKWSFRNKPEQLWSLIRFM